ncbi:MAG: hypothetical protein J6A11_10375, partial [Lachnospiraceae bacterium]|nr:hypothetical protein [Lachnospiraceae bacterium]
PTPPALQTVSHPQYISPFHPETSHNANYENITIQFWGLCKRVWGAPSRMPKCLKSQNVSFELLWRILL